MKRPHRILIVFLCTALLPLAALTSAHLLYDPLQLFRPSSKGPDWIHDNLRLQGPGIIRFRRFDSVLLGTSMMENTPASIATDLFGGEFINLSLTASDFFERALVLDFLLRQRPIQRVVYSLDSVYIDRRIGYRHFPLERFDFLYDRNRFNDIRVYFNRHFFGCLTKRSETPDCIGQSLGLDRPNAWIGIPSEAARFGGLTNWCAHFENRQIQAVWNLLERAVDGTGHDPAPPPESSDLERQIQLSLQYVDEHLLRLVREHPNVEFLLFFPPYSRLKFALWYQKDLHDGAAHLAVLHHLALAQEELSNLKVFGFEDTDIPDDLSLYKDLDHYHEDVDVLLLRFMAEGTGRILPAKADAYGARAVERGSGFNIAAFHAQLGRCGEKR